MSFSILACEQRSPEWRQARCGLVTSSRIDDMLANARKGSPESVRRRDLRIQLALERLTGVPDDDDYQSADMRRGIAKEAEAVRAYEAATGLMVRHSGFLKYAGLPIGCSLDGHVGDFDGFIEVKAPKRATHWEYLQTREIPEEYRRQITHSLFITGAQWADFVSFDDRFPRPLHLLRIRVKREDVDLKAYELLLRMFLSEVGRELDAITALMEKAAA